MRADGNLNPRERGRLNAMQQTGAARTFIGNGIMGFNREPRRHPGPRGQPPLAEVRQGGSRRPAPGRAQPEPADHRGPQPSRGPTAAGSPAMTEAPPEATAVPRFITG